MTRSLMVIVFLFISLIGWSQAPNPIDSLKKELEKAEGAESRAKLLNVLSNRYITINPDSGLSFGLQALELSRQLDLPGEMARSFNALGGNAAFLAEYEESIDYFNQSLAIYKEIGDVKGQADITGNLGMIYKQNGDYDHALDNQFNALTLFEEVEDSTGICNTLQSIGSIFLEMGDVDKAIQYNSSALKCFQDLKDKYGQAIATGNLANALSDAGRMDEVIPLQYKAIALFRELGSVINYARELGNLATTYESTGRLDSAVILAEECLGIFKESGFGLGLPIANGNIGAYYLSAYQRRNAVDTVVYFPPGNPDDFLDQAISYFSTAHNLALENGELTVVAWAAEKLADTYKLKGNYEAALSSYLEAHEIQDSIYSLETKAELQRLDTEREIALRDKQIELDRLAVQKKRNERVYFIIGLAGLLAIALLIFRNYRNQKVSNLQLKDLNKKISVANSELESRNYSLGQALVDLKRTQDQLIESEKQKEKALVRSKISQDIHDDISSGLTRISWLSETLKLKKAQLDEKTLGIVEKISQSSRQTVSKLGEIIWATSPERDNLGSLLSYMRRYTTEFFEGNQIKVRVQFPDKDLDRVVRPEVRRNLMLVLKEALNNAFKYSKANSLEVSISLENDQYEMLVADDGIGMQGDSPEGGGHGMNNMADRMKAIGGEMAINTGPDKGTKLIFSGTL